MVISVVSQKIEIPFFILSLSLYFLIIIIEKKKVFFIFDFIWRETCALCRSHHDSSRSSNSTNYKQVLLKYQRDDTKLIFLVTQSLLSSLLDLTDDDPILFLVIIIRIHKTKLTKPGFLKRFKRFKKHENNEIIKIQVGSCFFFCILFSTLFCLMLLLFILLWFLMILIKISFFFFQTMSYVSCMWEREK
jgi:hypothetical protein